VYELHPVQRRCRQFVETMSRATLDLWVGIFVTIGIAAILFLALKVGNLASVGSTPGYHLQAAFDNIGGLKLRAPVKAAGVVVGRVEQIRLDPQTYQAVVSMKIERGFQFTKDTIASILTSGLLGEVYIGLDSGGDTKMLADGDRIAKTQSAIVLEKLIGQFLFDKAATGTAPTTGSPASEPGAGTAAAGAAK
jgi:phospholipid/cholesterol/gamma-HCH transport system substrate-binding protein